jgi:hypothetical protein
VFQDEGEHLKAWEGTGENPFRLAVLSIRQEVGSAFVLIEEALANFR